MIKFAVKFSPEFEVERIKKTLPRLQWFKDNGYNIKLPESLVVNSSADISDDQIKMAVEAEYKEDDFKIQEAYLLENWHKVVDEVFVGIKKTSLIPRDIYTIYFTKYGVGGSYNHPDIIIVSMGSWGRGLLNTVFHEMVHLMIDQWIVEYKVSHWQKERIVDLIILKFACLLSRIQPISIEITRPIDRIFNEHYPNIELVIKNVGLLSQGL